MKKISKSITVSLLLIALCVLHGTAQGISPKSFGTINQEDIRWLPFPAFPAQARLAILVGDPKSTGPYVVRVKVPAGVALMPHTHPEDRIYTVIAGVFYIGTGTKYDPAR